MPADDDEADARSLLIEACAIPGEWSRPELLLEAQTRALLAAVTELRRIRRRS